MVRVPLYSHVKDEDDKKVLPIRSKSSNPVSVAIHRLPTNDGVIIKVTPPLEPAASISATPEAAHVPCDIVLVIDVSGSMAVDAPVPTVEGERAESNGLSVLDLVKHASRTILETLNEGDRLGIVTFESSVTVLQELVPMTPGRKMEANKKIQSMTPGDSTNLWQGMLAGIKLFNGKTNSGRVPAIMVLTDGMPNFMSPPQGFIPKMRTIGSCPAPIHTFGFGYSLRSGLLKSISEFTGGNYAFIPDAGMIGTVFVHAVANMQSTFATKASLRLTYPLSMTLAQTLGTAVDPENQVEVITGKQRELYVPIGNIQYGQSRDVYLRYTADADTEVSLDATLEYHRMSADVHNASASMNMDSAWEMIDALPINPDEVAFHISRSMLCAFLSTIFPLNGEDEHTNVRFSDGLCTNLANLIRTLPAADSKQNDGPMCKALMADVNGQVQLALSTKEYFNRWGKHYLPSLQGAHTAQQCNSFKDPGPLLYAVASPLFIACRNTLDTAFDTLPAPKPGEVRHPKYISRHSGRFGGGPSAPAPQPISMNVYRNSSGPCFASFCRVTLANGRRMRVNRLRKGMHVQTPRGPRAVAFVLKTPVSSIPMVTIGRLLVTAWHPISHNGSDWEFPCRDPSARKNPVRYTGSIYSVMLQPDDDADSHAISIEGLWVVTLGHGLTEKEDGADDVRVHSFLGDYSAVCRSLATLDVRKDGVVVNGGSARSNFRQWHTRK